VAAPSDERPYLKEGVATEGHPYNDPSVDKESKRAMRANVDGPIVFKSNERTVVGMYNNFY
jgi:hypothetical protein